MLKKRLIFTLLHSDGQYCLSRNFRLQRVGDMAWLQTNFSLDLITKVIDELHVLDVSAGPRGGGNFLRDLETLVDSCFVPVAAGGGISGLADVERLLRAGADKVVVNTLLASDPARVQAISDSVGAQCVVASIDVHRDATGAAVRAVGEAYDGLSVRLAAERAVAVGAGELLIQSVDRDGTGQGLDLQVLAQIPEDSSVPLVLMGGAGNADHLRAALASERVSAVATANLLNFVGDGLASARYALRCAGVVLPEHQ